MQALYATMDVEHFDTRVQLDKDNSLQQVIYRTIVHQKDLKVNEYCDDLAIMSMFICYTCPNRRQ